MLDEAGRLVLPAFVRATLARRGDGRTLLIGAHERAPCLIAYDSSITRLVHAELERQRVAAGPAEAPAHDRHARRAFGFVEETTIEAGGALALPPMMRRRARLGASILLVGTGAAFEIWDAEAARANDDADLAELAAFHLDVQQAA
jgi:MraZ protein